MTDVLATLSRHRASHILIALQLAGGKCSRQQLSAAAKIGDKTFSLGLRVLVKEGLIVLTKQRGGDVSFTEYAIDLFGLSRKNYRLGDEQTVKITDNDREGTTGAVANDETNGKNYRLDDDANGKNYRLGDQQTVKTTDSDEINGKKYCLPHTHARAGDLVVVNDPDLSNKEDNNNKPPPHPDRRAQFERDHVGDQTAIWQMLKDAGITSMSVKMAEILDMRLDERYVRAWCAHASETGMEPNVLIIRLLAGAESPPICPTCERSICQCRFKQPREELVITPLSEAASHWRDTLVELELQLTRATFNQWLKGSECLGREGSCYVVAVASDSAREWLQIRLIDVILKTLRCVSNDTAAEVRFEHEQTAI